MIVAELIQELYRLERPYLPVFIPCPHCCGQRGTDFDLLDAEYVGQIEHDGRQVVLLGDPREEGLGDRRSDRGYRVGKAAGEQGQDIAASLGLGYVRTLTNTDLEQMCRDTGGGCIARSRFSQPAPPLQPVDPGGVGRRGNPVPDGGDTVPGHARRHCSGPEVCQLMAELAGCPCLPVIACVVRDPSVEAGDSSSQIHWHFIEPGELEAE